MAKKKRSASNVAEPPAKHAEGTFAAPPLSEYELQRLAIIQRNRETFLAMGLPTIARQLQGMVQAPPQPKKPRVKKEPHPIKEEPADEAAAGAGPRRSSRLRDVTTNPKPEPESAEDRFHRELGQFAVEGECPRCHRVMEKRQKAHLQACSGAPAKARTSSGYSALDRELLAELSEEDRKDEHKRQLARMKALHLSGLIDFSPEAATFMVLGSQGDPYVITLSDKKHKCTCLSYRFRRGAPCKHILLVLTQLGVADDPTGWQAAVEGQLDDLVRAGQGGGPGGHPESVPRDEAAEVAMKLL